jgi:hypothetical protein
MWVYPLFRDSFEFVLDHTATCQHRDMPLLHFGVQRSIREDRSLIRVRIADMPVSVSSCFPHQWSTSIDPVDT